MLKRLSNLKKEEAKRAELAYVIESLDAILSAPERDIDAKKILLGGKQYLFFEYKSKTPYTSCFLPLAFKRFLDTAAFLDWYLGEGLECYKNFGNFNPYDGIEITVSYGSGDFKEVKIPTGIFGRVKLKIQA